jgi:hypothetical protein
MKGIYLTEESKKEIEAKIALYEFCNLLPHQVGELKIFKEILASATILPVEESWDNAIDTHDVENAFMKHYPNGVIIKSKQ